MGERKKLHHDAEAARARLTDALYVQHCDVGNRYELHCGSDSTGVYGPREVLEVLATDRAKSYRAGLERARELALQEIPAGSDDWTIGCRDGIARLAGLLNAELSALTNTGAREGKEGH